MYCRSEEWELQPESIWKFNVLYLRSQAYECYESRILGYSTKKKKKTGVLLR